ncbi:MAG: helix-turn-helix domain-containing protein [Candidatus Pacearchaeota archaeon]
MEDFRTKLKRQIEIISLVTENPNQYTIFDLAAKFNISEITVKRDLQEIRGMGIDIHSSGKKGINIFTPLNDEMIKLLIAQYTGIISYQNLIDKSVSLLVSKSGIRSLYLITTLQNAIEDITFHLIWQKLSRVWQKICKRLLKKII